MNTIIIRAHIFRFKKSNYYVNINMQKKKKLLSLNLEK